MGTWHAYNADGPRIFKNWSITDGARKIATVAEQPTTEAEHAHARLIAAAPELLAALEAWLNADVSSQECIKLSRAAIAKAHGND